MAPSRHPRWSMPLVVVVICALIGKTLHAQLPDQPTLATPAFETLPTPASGVDGGEFVMPVRSDPAVPVEVRTNQGLISLSVRDASLRQVLSALAETQGLNLVIAAPADAPVTAEFKRLPLNEVFATLLNSTGHTWTEHDGVFVVTSVATGGDLSPEVQGRRVAVIELDFASSADLQPAVEGLLSAAGQSHFLETDSADNRRTKELLIVEDLAPYVDRIERYIAEADQPPRQVLIEVNLLQVDLADDERCGVDFNALSRVSGARLSLRASGLTNPTASPGFFIESSEGDLDSVVEALISTTDAKSLAAPRLLALNGQESQIQIGERLGYRVTTTTQTSSLESVDFLEVGVVLSLTPRITRDGRVLLRVSPKVSSGAVNPDTGVPDEETTELHTDALLQSGQGMIIGGLIQERDDKRVTRIPVLGSLPYVNSLFQRRAIDKRRSELIVALVPHVLPYACSEVHERNEDEVFRARQPLLTGPLCRNPRPYEPTLYDPYRDERRLRLLDRRDPPCHADACVSKPELPLLRPRRLPPIVDGSETQSAEIAVRPTGTYVR
ncbi:Type IV pilus biogenesis and competence protein PilQ precursor [Planctomycetes bacterium MalM25]|nr:Type IV pilus biogenesis and competence protein PilQ precursor [Planctomycetes bacterium MalM25]